MTGQRPKDYVPGIYTFGQIDGTQELIYAQQKNPFRAGAAPPSVRLNLPSNATAISSALTGAGTTNLFVAASDGLVS